jgi:hypothetical protein
MKSSLPTAALSCYNKLVICSLASIVGKLRELIRLRWIDIRYFMDKHLNIKESLPLFLMDHGRWMLKTRNGEIDSKQKRFYLFLLPILEKECIDFEKEFERTFEKTIDETDFPLANFLRFPFDAKMEYWANLAMDWIHFHKDKLDLSEWAKELEVQWMSQKLKHRFWKELGIRSR